MQLDGKMALITGAGSGIGRALAIALAGKGAHVVLVGRRESCLLATAQRLGCTGATTILPCDVTSDDGVRRLGADIETRFGRLDLLVNNAGLVEVGPIDTLDRAVLEALIATNLTGPMLLTRSLLPCLRAAAPSRVVNVGSMLGDIAHPLFAAYSASKFGLRGWSDALRRELAPLGIGVTHAAPRATRTAAADRFSHLIRPFGMRLDEPADVARQIVSAIERDADTAYPPGAERVFLLAQKLLPRLVDRVMAKRLGQFRTQSL